MLSLYRDAIRIRRDHPGLATDAFRWVGGDASVLQFERGEGFACLVNLSTAAVPLPPGAEAILSSVPISGGAVPADAAVWYTTPAA